MPEGAEPLPESVSSDHKKSIPAMTVVKIDLFLDQEIGVTARTQERPVPQNVGLGPPKEKHFTLRCYVPQKG